MPPREGGKIKHHLIAAQHTTGGRGDKKNNPRVTAARRDLVPSLLQLQAEPINSFRVTYVLHIHTYTRELFL